MNAHSPISCDRCAELEAKVHDLEIMLGVTENDAVGEALWRAFRFTKTELRLALLLYAARGKTVSHWALNALFDNPDINGANLKVRIFWMRKKLGPDAIIADYGIGYALSVLTVQRFDEATRAVAA